MVDIKAYCDKRVEEILGIGYGKIPIGFCNSQATGSLPKQLRVVYNSVEVPKSPYIPTEKRGEQLRANLVGIEEKIYKLFEDSNFWLNSSVKVDRLINKIAKDTYTNPKYSVAIKRKDKVRRELDKLYKVVYDRAAKIHTNCLCGVEENPVAAFKELQNTDWSEDFKRILGE